MLEDEINKKALKREKNQVNLSEPSRLELIS